MNLVFNSNDLKNKVIPNIQKNKQYLSLAYNSLSYISIPSDFNYRSKLANLPQKIKDIEVKNKQIESWVNVAVENLRNAEVNNTNVMNSLYSSIISLNIELSDTGAKQKIERQKIPEKSILNKYSSLATGAKITNQSGSLFGKIGSPQFMNNGTGGKAGISFYTMWGLNKKFINEDIKNKTNLSSNSSKSNSNTNSSNTSSSVLKYNEKILETQNWLNPILKNNGYAYHELYKWSNNGENLQQPIIGNDGNIVFDTKINQKPRISCAVYVNEVLIHAGILNEGPTLWAWNANNVDSMINEYADRGVTLTKVEDYNYASPGDILLCKTDIHICILTEIDENIFKKTGSPEIFSTENKTGVFEEINKISDLNEENWIILRVTESSNMTEN